MGAWIALALLVVSGFLLVIRHDTGQVAGRFGGLDHLDIAVIASGAILAVWILFSTASNYRGRASAFVRDIAALVLFGCVALTAYNYRQPLRDYALKWSNELFSQAPEQINERNQRGEQSVLIRRGRGGQFFARSDVNGAQILMLVDTGASTVVLKPDDARAAGIDVTKLSYNVPVSTANGTTMAASVRIREIRVGTIVLRNVEALVAKPGTLKESLLGMSFLSRLRSYEFEKDKLTLRG